MPIRWILAEIHFHPLAMFIAPVPWLSNAAPQRAGVAGALARERASAASDPDGSPRLHDEAPCRWLAGGRVEPEAGWLDPGSCRERHLTGRSMTWIVRFNLTAVILWLCSSLSSIFSGSGSKMRKPEKSGVRDSDACPAVPPDAAMPPHAGPPSTAAQAPPLEISSETLLGGRTEVRIRHRGEIYRLTLTRAGKLILHK
jgi:hemin uptake protein HemP